MRLDQVIQGNDVVQQHVAAERGRQALTAVSPMARRAIQQEIIPQIEESVISPETAEDLCESTKRSIEAAFSFKNEIYTRLVSYKGIDQSDQQFLEDLLIVMDEWLRSTKASLRTEKEEVTTTQSNGAPTQNQEVNVNVNVNGEGHETDNGHTDASVETKKVSEERAEDSLVEDMSRAIREAIPLAFEDIFDLQDIRL